MNSADVSAQLAGKPYLVCGRAGMDFYPEPPGTAIQAAENFSAALGGSSANICVAITRQGGHASLVTCVSDDAIGRYCIEQLRQYGVNTEYVRCISGESRTSLAVSESRLEDHQTVIYRNNAADFLMSVDDVNQIHYPDYAALITTGTVLAAEPSRSASFHAFEQAKRGGLPLVFDLDYRPYSWRSAQEASDVYLNAASLCDVIIGNDVEFGFMAGDYHAGLSKARELACSTAAIVVYKMGERGAITLTADDEIRTGIFKTHALKPVGAGDSFLGGFIMALAAGFDLKTAVVRGSACAAMVVSRVGCAPAMPTSVELDEFLATRPEFD